MPASAAAEPGTTDSTDHTSGSAWSKKAKWANNKMKAIKKCMAEPADAIATRSLKEAWR